MMLIDALIAEREKRQQFSHEQALKRQMGHEVMRALSERLTAAPSLRGRRHGGGHDPAGQFIAAADADRREHEHRPGAEAQSEEAIEVGFEQSHDSGSSVVCRGYRIAAIAAK